MKVSIITPCYNASAYIANTITSVQKQTLTDWEMIIVDDGSTDNSVAVVKDIAIEDSRIKLIQKENGGSASARNVGLSVAQGEYIQFLDADDTIDIKKLELQTILMDKNQLDLTYTDYCISHPYQTTASPTKGHNFNLFKILIGWGLFGTIPLHAFLYRHTFLQEHQITNASEIKEREDWDWHIKVFSSKPKKLRLKGYCGADYFRCPTGKASNGSMTKLKIGTSRYLLYKIQHIRGYKQILLSLRLSIEFIEVVLLSILKKVSIQEVYCEYTHTIKNKIIFVFILILLPIAIPIYMARLFWLKAQH